jgi:hypothetical protein
MEGLFFMMMLATHPARAPKTIHDIIPIVNSPPFAFIIRTCRHIMQHGKSARRAL